MALKSFTVKVIAENANIGFYLSEEFDENKDMFVIVGDRQINPRDPRFRKAKNPYEVVVQTTEKL
jgi:proteasome assembly chaperone (PAC2) family protein